MSSIETRRALAAMAAPMDRGLNAAILHVANRLFPCGFDVCDVAPDTFDGLKAHVEITGRMLVWNGASDRTVFADDEVNFAFRAWHDLRHLTADAPFTPEGEAAACEAQIADLVTLFGDDERTRRWAAIMRAEVNGQVAHLERHGAFPVDQAGFVAAWLVDADAALARPW